MFNVLRENLYGNAVLVLSHFAGGLHWVRYMYELVVYKEEIRMWRAAVIQTLFTYLNI